MSRLGSAEYFVESHIPGFAEFSSKKLLEIRCGMGTDTINFACSGAEVTVVDVSTESPNDGKGKGRSFCVDK